MGTEELGQNLIFTVILSPFKKSPKPYLVSGPVYLSLIPRGAELFSWDPATGWEGKNK